MEICPSVFAPVVKVNKHCSVFFANSLRGSKKVRHFVMLELSFLDRRTQPCQNIIDEVIGRYIDVAPIQKVSYSTLASSSINSKLSF